MATIRLTRTASVPDPLRLTRCRKAPDVGPRLLFFSGGTALRPLSRELVQYTHNSIHLITPFDSGGSSAGLRQAFGMPAVGDLRNRLMALADQSMHGQPQIYDLFTFRFPEHETDPELHERLDRMIEGVDPLVSVIDQPMRWLIRNHLQFFRRRMPDGFDLRGASLGNLILAGGYLNQDRHIDPVIYLFSKLAEVRGVVRPISSTDLHLAAELEGGDVVVGQHRLTGKETAPLERSIRRLYLTADAESAEPASLLLKPRVAEMIREAELICYPPGSFYTSLIANLLPHGVGDAIAGNGGLKVYIPNTGHDPEQAGLSLSESVRTLLSYLRAGSEHPGETTDLLQHVMVDARGAGIDRAELRAVERLGVSVIDLPLITTHNRPLLDPTRLAEALISLL